MMVVDLKTTRRQLIGLRFFELIQNHLRTHSQSERLICLRGACMLAPDPVPSLFESFVDRWGAAVQGRKLWQSDAAEVFDEITSDARDEVRPYGLANDDGVIFSFYYGVILVCACNAYLYASGRAFKGVPVSSFPWLSALALTFPICLGFARFVGTGMGLAELIERGSIDLGCILVAAGLLSETFRVVRLRRRRRVIMIGVGLILLGAWLATERGTPLALFR